VPKEPIVIFVMAYPEPEDVFARFHCERTVVQADACGSKTPDLLELKGRMRQVRFEQFEVGVG